MIINKYPQQTATLELLELAIQRIYIKILVDVFTKYLVFILIKIVELTLNSMKTGRTVSEGFKIFLVNNLFNLVNQSFQQKNFNQCLQWLDAMEEFNIPLDKDFYNLKANVYIHLNMKKEAIQTIENHL